MKFCTKYENDHVNRKGLTCGQGVTDASFEPECRIDRILWKYTHNLPLETWQVNQREAVFADVSAMPKDPAEAHKWMSDLQQKFNDLPAELRREYHDSLGEYMVSLQTNPKDTIEKAARLMESHRRIKNPTLVEMLDTALERYRKSQVEANKSQVEAKKGEVKNAPTNA